MLGTLPDAASHTTVYYASKLFLEGGLFDDNLEGEGKLICVFH